MRSTSTRVGVLHQLRAFDLCHHRPNFACVLYLNQAYWPEHDAAIRHFISGDYIRLVVICPGGMAPRDAAIDLRDFERSAVRQRIFGRAPSSSESASWPSASNSPVSVTSQEPSAPADQSTHVSDRWCCGGLAGVSSSSVVTPISLLLEDHLLPFPDWHRALRNATFSSGKVTALRDYLVDIKPWPESAFSREWTQIPEAHEFVALIDRFQTPISSVGDFHIFLDGSFFPSTGSAAWSFSVVLRSNQGDFFRWGFTGGILEEAGGSLHAEAHAMAFALDWVVATLACSRRSVYLYGDATAVGYGASGSQKIAAGLEELGALVRHLFCISQAALPHLEYRHIKAHCGQVDNELVDSLARAIASQEWSPHVGVPDIQRWSRVPLLDWAWLLIENFQAEPSSLPCLDDLASGRSFPAVPQPAIDPFEAPSEISQDKALATVVNLKFGSANVRTLKEGCSEGGLSDKIELLSAQMRAKNYDVLAVQESRARVDRTTSFGSITRLVSAADHGQGGVELWVNADGPLSQGSLGPLKATHFHVQASSPTFLVANCDHPLLQCTFVIAYAPQGGRLHSEIVDWWSTFSQLLAPLVGKDVVLMGDFNAHIGAVETVGIGSFGWATENLAGGHLRSLVEDHALCVPSTFSHFHSGPTTTFRSASGGNSRVDYIAVPHAWILGIKTSFVDVEFDLLSGDYDHFVVALELEMSITPCSGVNRPRRPLYDRQAARAHPDLLRRMIHSIPPVAWGVGLDQHWEVIEKHCSAFLRRHFPLPKRHVRQEYFSSKTWSLLCHRKDTSIQVRAADARINRWQLLRFFGLWRTVGGTFSVSEPSSVPLAHCYQERALLLWSRAKLDVLFRESRKQDLVFHRSNCALDFRHTVSTGNPALMFQALRPKRPVNRDKGFKVSRPLPALDLSTTNPDEHTRRRYLRVWELHFASIESSC